MNFLMNSILLNAMAILAIECNLAKLRKSKNRSMLR